MGMILHEPLVPPSTKAPMAQFPPAFDMWFARSCDRDPMRRWASVGEQVTALADAFGLPVPGSISMNGPFVPATQSHSGVMDARFQGAMNTPAPTAPPVAPRSMAGFWVALMMVIIVGAGAFVGYRMWQNKQASVGDVEIPTKPIAHPTTTATATTTTSATAAAAIPTTTTPTAVETLDLTGTPTATATAATATATTATATSTSTGSRPKKPDKEDPWAR
jgi:hypothetical protein